MGCSPSPCEGRTHCLCEGDNSRHQDGWYTRDMQSDPPARVDLGDRGFKNSYNSVFTPGVSRPHGSDNYHEAVDNAPEWEASFCWPEGFMRWWAQASQGGDFQLTTTPWSVQFLSGIADNFLRQVWIGRQPVQQVPQWYGETVGFWDGPLSLLPGLRMSKPGIYRTPCLRTAERWRL